MLGEGVSSELSADQLEGMRQICSGPYSLVAHLGITTKWTASLCPPPMIFRKMNNSEAAEGGRERGSEIEKIHSNLKMDWKCQTNRSPSWVLNLHYSYTFRSYETCLSLTLCLNMELPIQRSCLAFNHSCLSPWQSQSCSTPTEGKPYGVQLDSCSGLSYSCTLRLLPMIHPINCHVNSGKYQMRVFFWTFGHLAKKGHHLCSIAVKAVLVSRYR